LYSVSAQIKVEINLINLRYIIISKDKTKNINNEYFVPSYKFRAYF